MFKKILQATLGSILLILMLSGVAEAQVYLWRYRSHATDCTALTDGKPRDMCFEVDAETLYKCQPSSGDCSGAEWKLVSGSGAGDLLADGSVPLTANWDVGNYDMTMKAATGDGVATFAGFTIGSAVIGEAELEILDGATITTAETETLSDGSNADALHVHASAGLSGIVNADLSGSAGITGANILDDTIDSGDYNAGSIDFEHIGTDLITGAGAVGAFTSGDTFLCMEAGVGIRECDYDDMPGAGGGMTSFILEDDDGTEISISNAEEIKFIDTTGLTINWTDTTPGSDADPFDMTFTIDPDAIAGAIAEGAYANSSIVGADIKDDTVDSDDYAAVSIDAEHVALDVITHAQIADADQTVSYRVAWIENPTDADDFKSVWANKTANAFQITEIWGESDQTVSFDLQIDDGAPADCDSDPVAPAAGEAEVTDIDGDCLLSAGEELDLVIGSVANAPTWVSIVITGNWVD